MKAKKIISLLLCALMLVSIVPMSVLSTSAAQTENNETSATYNYQANSMYQLEMYLKVAGNCNIKLTGDCLCSHEVGSEGHTALKVYGNKTIDLNGYEIICNDETNVKPITHDHPTIYGDCITNISNEKANKFLIEVEKNSVLTINDSSGSKGRIHYDGRNVGYTKGPYVGDGHFYGDSERNI